MNLQEALKFAKKSFRSTLTTGICDICNNLFFTTRITSRCRKFCSKKCMDFSKTQKKKTGKYVYCRMCFKKFWKMPACLQRRKKHFCSRKCYYQYSIGRNHPTWKKGHHKRKNGYLYMSKKGMPFPIHRIVMEQHIGRRLKPFESVHHKNGIKHDNRIENLELWTTRGQPCGQRVQDLLAFCIKNYRKELIYSLKG